ncbi:hypothetical protein ACROYT_G000318 [Oculina patagonica]
MAELEQTPIAQEEQKQVTSTTPATKPAKNPKRVAAGKLAAEKTKQAREAQKKAAVEAAAIIAKEKEKKSAAAKRNVTPPAVTEPAPPEAQPQSSGLTTNQWISLLGIGVAIVTTYVKREDIKAFIKEKRSPTIKAPPTLITDDTPVTAESSLRDDFIETSSGVEEYEEDNQQEEARERQRVYNEGYNAEQKHTMASVAIMAGGAILNAAAFIGGNYLARALGGGDDAALKEKERHDKALEAYQAAYAKYSRDRTKLLDWIETNNEIKQQAKQNFTNTDYAFKLYNQAHPDKQMIPPKEPKFSDFYQPSEQQKQGELMFVGAGALALGYAAFRFL